MCDILSLIDPIGSAIGVQDLVFGGDDGGGGPVSPKARTMIDEGRDTLDAFRVLAPEQLGLQAEFGPKYAASQGNTLAAYLAGSLPLYERQIAPTISRTEAAANTAQRTADLGDVEKLGPRALEALRNFDQGSTTLADLMLDDAKSGLEAGATLTPAEQRRAEQSVRSAQAAKGMGYGPSDALQESLATFMEGNNLKRERQNFAGNVINQRKQLYGDPWLQILGRPSSVVSNSNQLFGQNQAGSATTVPDYNPFTAYAGDLNNTNFNAMWSDIFSQRNVAAAEDAANKQLIGSIVGGVLGAAGGAAI